MIHTSLAVKVQVSQVKKNDKHEIEGEGVKCKVSISLSGDL